MDNRKFGYIRVSTKDQNEARQMEQMLEAGLNERDIFVEKQSGRNFERSEYQIIKRMLRKGDSLYVTSLDRFGRNKEDILNEWNDITKKIEANIVVMDMPLLNTEKDEYGAGKLISDLMLQILSWLAEEERNRIKKRQREGIEVAKKKGKHLGRPHLEYDAAKFEEIYHTWKRGEITAVTAYKTLDMKKTTFYRMVKQYESENLINS